MKLSTLYIFLGYTICLTITCFTLHFLTYFPHLKTTNTSAPFLLGIAIIPSFYVGIKSSQILVDKNKSASYWKDALIGTPKFLKVILILVIPYVIFNFFYSLMYLTGGNSPDIIDGSYFLTSKGRVIRELSESQYFEYLAYEFRGISGHYVLFQLISLAMISSVISVLRKKSSN
jgi:hypothetical protein